MTLSNVTLPTSINDARVDTLTRLARALSEHADHLRTLIGDRPEIEARLATERTRMLDLYRTRPGRARSSSDRAECAKARRERLRQAELSHRLASLAVVTLATEAQATVERMRSDAQDERRKLTSDERATIGALESAVSAAA